MVVNSSMNALHNVTNDNQGPSTRVLCVCSAGLLRSPTIANVLSRYGHNTRACGVHDYALVPISTALIRWADKIVFAEQEHYESVKSSLPEDTEYYVLDLPDAYPYMNSILVSMVEKTLANCGDWVYER